MPKVVAYSMSMYYDGTNGAEVAEWIGNGELVKIAPDGALELAITDPEFVFRTTVPPDRWVIQTIGAYQGSLTPQDYATNYHELPPST
ncbi:hypothetical protein [Streptomyces sp. NPDC051657]|uniref:hypothetical protein n=1 Tax=unclassified Streptomyces TaxID=2593676 RepID=UPI003447ED43